MESPLLLTLALLLAPAAAIAQTPAPEAKEAAAKLPLLKVGDKAPALTIEKWVKGAPVASFEKGKVYMIEFWATWCRPCIASMPHITELQKKHKEQGLTVIGVSSVDKRGNSLEAVEKMVGDKGDAGMGYTIAWDKERATSDVFMKAAERNGIPCSFLIDRDGYIAYIGHPTKIDETMEAVLAGKHDLKALAEKYARAKENEAKANAIQVELTKAAQAKEWDAVIKGYDSLIALDPAQYAGAAVSKFRVLAVELKDPTRAFAYANEVLTGIGKSDSNVLNALAWTIVDPAKPLLKTDADLAIKLATRAAELTERKNAAILDTLARAYFTKGDVAKAIEIQTEAVKIEATLKPALDEYTSAKEGKKIGN